ncbi:hypothetical protein GCM10009616_33960 [Microlunatus lacustris]
MLLDEPQACPTFEGLTFDALAVSPTGQHYLVVSIRPPGKPMLRVHLGPDPDTIARHGMIVVAALRTHAGRYADPEFGVGILTWLALCWTEIATELDHATDNLNRDVGSGAARGGAVGAGAVA